MPFQLAALELDKTFMVTAVYLLAFLVTTVSLGWAVTRTSALSAWRDAAMGYKEQASDLSGRLSRAEEQIVLLTKRIVELEAFPDLSDVIAVVREEAESIRRELPR